MEATEHTFTVGGESPTVSLVGFAGRVFTHRELTKGEEVHVQVVDSGGEVIADGYGRVVGITFKDRFDKDGDLFETARYHSVKVS